VLAELVTSARLTPFCSASKSAATSGQTVSKELHSHTFCPTQQGHPLASLPFIRLFGETCQLCTLPLEHIRQCHQMSLWLLNVASSGKFPFLLFLSWSHCSSKACFTAAKVGCFCLVPSAFLPAIVLAHLGHPVFSRALCVTAVYHSCKQAVNFLWALMWLWTVTWSGDNGWFFSANHNSATCGGFVANVSC